MILKEPLSIVIENKNTILDFCKVYMPLILSAIGIYIALSISFRERKISMRRATYPKVFEDILTDYIPEIYDKYVADYQFKLEDSNDFQKCILVFMRKIIVFKFKDKRFYNCLRNILKEIDEKVTLLADCNEDRDKLLNELDTNLKNLYQKIEKYYK